MKRKHKALIAIFLVIGIGLFFGVRGVRSIVEKLNAGVEHMENMDFSDLDLKLIENGTYEGSYSVFPISVKVKVTVENHKITSIELIRHSNGRGAPAEKIIDKVLKKQSLQVDAVSGATYSSNVILKAIENALVEDNDQ
ncbi:hypothetical protein CHISP_0152 [Chitinispirillum alkaliphilum]|nr:hypothetical protein CHISP_0152 [Chitinispirillum alkaliphilum]